MDGKKVLQGGWIEVFLPWTYNPYGVKDFKYTKKHQLGNLEKGPIKLSFLEVKFV